MTFPSRAPASILPSITFYHAMPIYLSLARASSLCLISTSLAFADDLILTDFEATDFGSWKTTGNAFGSGPASGALDGQMDVTGFHGTRLANSYHKGDDATGTLSSPAFKIERKHLNFLIGGGGFPGETCINLIANGKILRSATGPNTKPGGSERLSWQSWDVSDLIGTEATIEIIDNKTGSWGHITVDHIVQSDAPAILEITKEFPITQRYLIWPVTLDTSEKQRFFLTLDGEETPFTYSDICLSNNPDFWVFTDLADFEGRILTVSAKLPKELAQAWEKVAISATFPGQDTKEPLRPAYHFTSRRGWLNDPNGMVFHKGTWHLFYQHNPYNHGWDNMHWGHATSTDLVTWQEHPPALFPDANGYMYSGSGFVVPKKASNLPLEADESIVLAYTAEGTRSYVPGRKTEQAIAYSNDGGKTFTKFSGNPVVPHIRAENRDPKIFWHADSKHWVMTLYYEHSDYGIHISPDLVNWTKTCDYQIPGEGECPDMFELAVDGDPQNTRWVVWGANGIYMLGSFDGRVFTPESGPHRHYFGSAYAGQSFDNAPGNRRVHIGWLRDSGPGLRGAPFNQQMTLPMDFTLRTENGKIRLHTQPSQEIAAARSDSQEWTNLTIEPGDADPLVDFTGGHFEIEAVIAADSQASEIGFRIFGEHDAIWKKSDQSFTNINTPIAPFDGKLNISLFVDTVSIEVFVNGTYTGKYLRQTPGMKPARIIAKDGPIHFETLKIHQLKTSN